MGYPQKKTIFTKRVKWLKYLKLMSFSPVLIQRGRRKRESKNMKNRLENRGNKEEKGAERQEFSVEIVETEHAEYRIVKSFHVMPNTKEELGKPDMVVLETGSRHYRDNPEILIKKIEDSIQYGNILVELKNRETPIYFIDTPFKPTADSLIKEHFLKKENETKHLGKRGIAFGLSLAALIKEIRNNDKVTRRDFFRKITTAGGALFLLTKAANPVFELADRYLNPLADKDKLDIEEKYGDEKKVTSELVLSLRNLIIAQKLEDIAKTIGEGKKPKITVFIGSLHVSFDEMSLNELLKIKEDSDENRIKLINKFFEQKGFAEYVIDPKEAVRISSVRFSKADGEWKKYKNYDDYFMGGGRG